MPSAAPYLPNSPHTTKNWGCNLRVATFTAFYDANVLYPAELRNLFMHLALTGLFRAKWSADVHEEWISALLEKRPDLTREKLERTRTLMDLHAIDALVTGYEDLIPGLQTARS